MRHVYVKPDGYPESVVLNIYGSKRTKYSLGEISRRPFIEVKKHNGFVCMLAIRWESVTYPLRWSVKRGMHINQDETF